MGLRIELGENGIDHTGENPRRHLKHRHINPALRRDGCNFKADIAAAHDDHLPAFIKLALDRFDIFNGAKVKHAVQVKAWNVQLTNTATGCEYELVVPSRAPVIQVHQLFWAFHFNNLASEQHFRL